MDFMKKASDLAYENVSTHAGGPFGCVIVRNNEIVATGANSVVSHCDPTAHAEIVALRNACQVLNDIDLSECDVYSSCEPCPMCYGALKWARVRHIYFSNTRVEAAAIGFRDDDIYNQIIEQKQDLISLRTEQSLDAFRLWSEQTTKALY